MGLGEGLGTYWSLVKQRIFVNICKFSRQVIDKFAKGSEGHSGRKWIEANFLAWIESYRYL